LLPTAAGFFMFFFYVGLEAGYGSWLATFMVELEIADAEGAALMTSCYWGALTVGASHGR
jgi:fucose permease